MSPEQQITETAISSTEIEIPETRVDQLCQEIGAIVLNEVPYAGEFSTSLYFPPRKSKWPNLPA